MRLSNNAARPSSHRRLYSHAFVTLSSASERKQGVIAWSHGKHSSTRRLRFASAGRAQLFQFGGVGWAFLRRCGRTARRAVFVEGDRDLRVPLLPGEPWARRTSPQACAGSSSRVAPWHQSPRRTRKRNSRPVAKADRGDGTTAIQDGASVSTTTLPGSQSAWRTQPKAGVVANALGIE
jgi:hypothetical protein